MAEALLQIVLEKLSSIIRGEIALLWGVNEDLEILSNKFSAIRVLLVDAEEKQMQDKQIKDWLLKLRSVSYELDDILDEWQTEASKMDHEGQKSKFSKKVQTWFLTTCSVGFRRKIGKQIKQITKKLDEIAKERHMFHLREIVVENGLKVPTWRETSSLITEPQVYGRGKDQEEIVQLITRDANDCGEGIAVLPIVGIGGLGKTTLAKLIFNDERAKSHFEPRIWICVSEDFDLRRIIKSIIESITSGQAIRENSELDLLQKNLSEKLFGKRYLLVLDDVWNDDKDKWDKLKASLDFGSRGAFVLTTTRSDMVARIMGTLQPHSLSVMSKGDCLSLFKNYAFGQLDGEHSNLVKIGEKIVEKCGGLPLAAKTLGSLLHFKTDENQWNDVLESEIWNLKQPEGSILPALRLSYFHLPFSVRQCFGYCAVFLKDTRIVKEELINMWMASGLLSSGGSSKMENTGEDIWNELYLRSFFQNVKKYSYFEGIVATTFEMHDLMHDLAHSVIEEEHLTLHLERMTRTIPRKDIRHITAVGQDRVDHDLVFPEMMYEFQSLRTLIFLQVSLEKNFIKIDFTKFGLLRVLDAEYCSIKKVPSSIGSLNHLRYLNISNNTFEGLPKTICNLRNLQTLDVSYCYSLGELPKHMRRLRNLRHLLLQGCVEIAKMPPGIRDLTDLQTLSLFVVGEREEDHSNLSELQGLDLGGSLVLKHLERVGNPKAAEIANLVAKQNLRCLDLRWIDTDVQSPVVTEQILEALQPHSNLKRLMIKGYKGTHLPHWMEDLSVLANVEFLLLVGCTNCRLHPVLGQLPLLRELHVYRMECVEYCDNDLADVSISSGIVRRFPSLEYMDIKNLPNLIGLSRSEESSYGRELFPRLHTLCIRGCGKLTNLPTSLPSLQKLEIEIYCNSVLNCISHFQSLTRLDIDLICRGVDDVTSFSEGLFGSLTRLDIDLICRGVDDVTSFSEGLFGNLTSLVSLRLVGFTKLKEFPADLANLSALKKLEILHFKEIESLPEQGVRGLRSLQFLRILGCDKLKSVELHFLIALQELQIENCPELVDLSDIGDLNFLRDVMIRGLKALPQSLQHARALQILHIRNCSELPSLPDWLGNLSSLQTLEISDCPQLKSRCEKGKGEDWPKIKHIRAVDIN